MMEKLDLVGIIKDGTVYVTDKVTDTGSWWNRFSSSKIRFDVEEIESFNKNWRVFSSIPTTAEQFIVGESVIIRYKLKEGFTETDKTPKTMTKEAFRCCGDDQCDNPEIRGLYEPVFRKGNDEWVIVPLQLEIIDSDCEPLLETKYKYHVKFPGYINKHMVVKHTLPCYVKGKDVFQYIVKEVKKNIPDHCFISSDYDFHFRVDVRIPHEKNPVENKTMKAIEISTDKWKYGTNTKDVEGNNYFDLENKMDAMIKEYIDKMTHKIVVCPSCGGCGWLKDTKEEH